MVELNISTTAKIRMADITRLLEDAVIQNGWEDGILTVFTPHTTAAVTINENADPDVQCDMTAFMNKLVPDEAYFRHSEGNSDAHIKSSLFGCSETIIVENSRLVLGTWQGVYFCEFDGPRQRKVWLKFIGK
ncbi:secondary thiamine-phosphate synthase enzyme YjbQ [Geovibrio sp. ADMFC3]